MKENNFSEKSEPIKIITVNTPTEKEAEERIKKLSAHLGKIWKPLTKEK